MSMITMENYEEFMILQADGELQPHEAQALDAFLAEHPELRAEMDIYSGIRMAPDEKMVYAHKESLLKPEPAAKKVIGFPAFRTYAAAAGIAAVLVITGAMFWRNTTVGDHSNGQLASNTPAIVEKPAAVASSVINEHPAATTTISVTTPEVNNQPVARHDAIAGTNKPEHMKKEDNPSEEKAPQPANVNLVYVATGDLKTLPVSVAAVDAPSQVTATLPDMGTAIEETKQTWFDKLPIDENKKKNINNVATAVATGCEKINSFKENIASRGLSLRIEKKNLIVSF